MAQVLNANPNGTWDVQRDDGSTITTAYLPPGLQQVQPQQVAAPLAPPEPTTLPPAAPAPASAPAGPRIVEEQRDLAGNRLLKIDEGGVVRAVPVDWVTGPALEAWDRKVRGESPAQPLAADDPTPMGNVSPAVAFATAKARGLPTGYESAPGGLFGMHVGAPENMAAPSGIGPGGQAVGVPAPQPATNAPVPHTAQPETVDLRAKYGDIPQAPAGPSVTSATSTIRFSPVGPSRAEKELDEANAKVVEGIAATAALEAEKAAVIQAKNDVHLEAERKRMADEEQRAAFRQKAQEDAEMEVRAAVDSLGTPSGKLDPDRWWSSRDTGQKVAAFASAFLSGFAGRPDVIQQAIDADIAAQKDALDRADRSKSQKVEGRKLLLGTMRERFQDEIMAERAARVAASEYALKVIERETAGFKGREAQAKAQELIGVRQRQLALDTEALRDNAAQRGLKQAEYALNVQARQQSQQQALAARGADMGQPVPLANLTPEQRERAVILPGGQFAVVALDKEAAKKAREATIAHDGTDDAIRRLMALRQEYGGEVFPTEAKAKMKSLKEEVILRMKDSLNLGVMSDSDYQLMERLIGGDASSVFSTNALATLEDLRKRGRDRYLSQVQQYGINPVPPSFTPREKPQR
jgi:hypothetical protein